MYHKLQYSHTYDRKPWNLTLVLVVMKRTSGHQLKEQITRDPLVSLFREKMTWLWSCIVKDRVESQSHDGVGSVE